MNFHCDNDQETERQSSYLSSRSLVFTPLPFHPCVQNLLRSEFCCSTWRSSGLPAGGGMADVAGEEEQTFHQVRHLWAVMFTDTTVAKCCQGFGSIVRCLSSVVFIFMVYATCCSETDQRRAHVMCTTSKWNQKCCRKTNDLWTKVRRLSHWVTSSCKCQFTFV